MNIHKLDYRKLVKISGVDSVKFLQNILSNDIGKINETNLQYNLLLTPQGKISYDFFIFKFLNEFYLDCHAKFLNDIKKKLQIYKLHSDVQIENFDAEIFICDENLDIYCYPDPRHTNLGYRYYNFIKSKEVNPHLDINMLKIYDGHRLQCLIPEFGIDFMPEEFFPLDLGIDRLNGISFNKGCYVGQEVTARMNYRGKRKKYLEYINLNDYIIRDKDIIKDDKKIGVILKTYNTGALSLLKK